MNSFDLLRKEVDQEFMEAEGIMNDIYLSALNYLTEDGESTYSSEKKMNGIITRIRRAIQNVIDRFRDLFADKKMKDIEKAIKENPELANTKVQVENTDKLDELAEQVSKGLQKAKSKEDLEAQMKKYRSQRNKILATSAVVTITLSALLVKMKKNKDEKINKLKKKTDKLEEQCSEYSKKMTNASKKIQYLKKETKKARNDLEVAKQDSLKAKAQVKSRQVKESIGDSGKKFAESVDGAKAIISANAEIIKDSTHDVITEMESAAKAVARSKTKVQKVANTVSGVKKVTESVKNSSKSADQVYANKRAAIKKDAEKIKKSRERAKAVLKNPEATTEQKKKAKDYMDKSMSKLSELKRQYDVLKKD